MQYALTSDSGHPARASGAVPSAVNHSLRTCLTCRIALQGLRRFQRYLCMLNDSGSIFNRLRHVRCRFRRALYRAL